ncbi:MAG: hypothetical protein JSS50_01910 [Proteobacteria bacterium]|nr:hypothetical protein [Pseudomonadota bacterium]
MNNYEIRYVFDIGSGTTKSMSCLVDKTSGQLLAVLDQISISVPYQKYINNSADGKTLSAEAMQQGYTALNKIIQYYGIDPTQASIKCAGIATAWARNANNASDYLDYIKDELGLNVEIVSQKYEGELGIKAVLANPACPVPDQNKMLVWDIGGGSFQLTYLDDSDNIQVYNGAYGSSNFAKVVRDAVLAPQDELMSQAQMLDALDVGRMLISQPLKAFVDIATLQSNASSYVYAIGQFMNSGIQPMVQQATISQAELYDIMLDYSTHSLDELSVLYPEIRPEFLIPQQTNLILAYNIMEALGMEQLHFTSNATSLNAIAVDDKLWDDAGFADIWEVAQDTLYPGQLAIHGTYSLLAG